ncbi:MAG TPA: alpha/beta hydrolase-fold protein [Candidatus Acidoferrales bacterium]|nr:alpha/beta hydrolase-fold protein [Candidatus Acidoferrales bacterium]
MKLRARDLRRLTARTMTFFVLATFAALLAANAPTAPVPASNARFEVSFPESAHSGAITGRVFIFISQKETPEPRLQAGGWGDTSPLFGLDVNALAAGQPAVLDASTPGYPTPSLSDIAAGDYYVQALVNVYTEFHRADGHTIWAHMDQWEGQRFNHSPGNLYSEVQRVHLDPASGYEVHLSLTKVIPPVEEPADTPWVKHIKIQSEMLTKFWGHPMYIGATVLLPKGYDEHPNSRYPVIYEEGHFSLGAPFGFSTNNQPVTPEMRARLADVNRETGYEFYQSWNSDNFPRMIAVTFQHPTPYFDDSYAVNSVNNGPYGDALVKEMIPYLEAHFRMIPQPYARVLTGGSTGGWESIGVQVFYPDFFGGTWTLYPDPVDFRRYQLSNIYDDDNVFFEPGHIWLQAPRYMQRKSDGQPEVTMQAMSQLEDVLGSHGRSAQQMEIWEAAYGPVGDDGYPKPLWDKQTGKIDHSVALYMRDHGYDLSYNLRSHWSTLGPKLRGKIHIYVGDMDNYYLNLAVYDLEDVLKAQQNPPCDCEFQYGRPMKGHGWQPASTATLVRWMADHVAKNAPTGENTSGWHY